MRFWRPAIGGLAAIAFTVAAVWVNIPEHVDPANNIAYVEGGVIDNLVIVDDDFKYWSVTEADRIRPTADDMGLTFRYYTSACEKNGLVGYVVDETPDTVALTVVEGESDDDCGDMAVAHHATVPLAAPLGDRRTLSVKPVR